MSLQKLTETAPGWISTSGVTPEPVVLRQIMLARNLAGFGFPNRCPDEERHAAESRLLRAFSAARRLPPGQYHPITEMDVTVQRFIVERRLAPVEFLGAQGTRGVYVTDDQSLAILVNMSDHMVIWSLSNSGSLEEQWKVADALDNDLSRTLSYAYHERLGYLTSSLRLVGTGLKAAVLLHLPAITMLGEAPRIAALQHSWRLSFHGLSLGEPHPGVPAPARPPVFANGSLAAEVEPVPYQSLYLDASGVLQTDPVQTVGNLYVLASQDTLGVSEKDTLFQVEQAVSTVVREEEAARERLLNGHHDTLMDSIGRALGVAQSARLLGMRETLLLASMIRLAAAMGLVTGCNCNALNQALLECQQAHLQLLRGLAPEPHALAVERARMFRALFARTEMN